jgi:hypothetical protein
MTFRGLFFEHNSREIGAAFHRAGAEIRQKDHLWMDTNSFQKIQRRCENIIPESVFKGGFKHLKMNDPIHFGKDD